MKLSPPLLAIFLLASSAALLAQTGPPMYVPKTAPTRGLEVGDFDLDGLPDAFYVNYSGVHVDLNYGIGNLPYTLDFPSYGGVDLEVVDLDQDGDLDILVLNSVDTINRSVFVHVLVNNGGLLTGTSFTLAGTRMPALADINNDGLVDLLAAETWHAGLAPGVFDFTPQDIVLTGIDPEQDGAMITERHSLLPGDFDGDGDSDLLRYRRTVAPGGISSYYSHVDLFVNDGTGSFSYHASEVVAPPGYFLPIAEIWVEDLNQDGIDDFITAEHSGNAQNAYLGDPSGRFMTGKAPLGLGTFLCTADLDGDGDLEILLRHATGSFPSQPLPNPSVRVLENLGGSTWVESTSSPLSFDSTRIRSADLDLDGKDDLVFSELQNGIHYGVALGNLTPQTTAPVTLNLISGDNQTTTWPAPAAQPLVLELRDGPGLVFPGQQLQIKSDPRMSLPSSATTDALGRISLNLLPADLVGSVRITIGKADMTHQRFELEIRSGRVITPISGLRQGTNPVRPFPEPVVVEVRDLAGNPVAGASVDVRHPDQYLQSTPTYSATTDAAGRASITAFAVQFNDADFGDLGLNVVCPGATRIPAQLFQRHIEHASSPIAGTFFYDHVIRYHHENPFVPIILMADVPQPAPVPSIYGDWHTSFLSPQPTLFYLDGLGLAGPPVPGLLTLPAAVGSEYSFSFSSSALPQGTTVVFQVLSYDNAYGFPAKVGLSNRVIFSIF